MRLAKRMTRGSWVEKMKVTLFFSLSSFIAWRIVSPVAPSRLAVGSSAITSRGSFAKALAMATRCLWPPDSSSGLWDAYSSSPTRPMSSSTRRRRSSWRWANIRGISMFSAIVSTGTRLKLWR